MSKTKAKPDEGKPAPPAQGAAAPPEAPAPPAEGTAPPPEPPAKTPEPTESRKARAKQVFGSHNVDVIYFTHDNECFVNKSYAHMHAATLKDMTVTPFTRKELK